jgi:pimeloyl-ACP methyl ester carboxylesterase
VNRTVFAAATPQVLLADYRAGLRCLREQPDIDPGRILLLGASEGTRLAPRLALAEPAGVVALALIGYSEHGTKDTIVWQHTVGPWRNVARIFDADHDQTVTRQEYDDVVRRKGQMVADALPFHRLDRNQDGTITPAEMNQRAAADAILDAVKRRDDDYLYDNVLCLSGAYLLEEWEAPPTHETLLQLDLPLGIFHGENDGACRVEGVLEAETAFEKTGRGNLIVRIYPGTDHDLNWASFLREGNVPPAFDGLFGFIELHARPDSAAARSSTRRQDPSGHP